MFLYFFYGGIKLKTDRKTLTNIIFNHFKTLTNKFNTMILKKLFNSNTGYFINTHAYWYDCKTEIGYIVCQGYRMFGIFGFNRLGIFTDKTEAENYLKSLI